MADGSVALQHVGTFGQTAHRLGDDTVAELAGMPSLDEVGDGQTRFGIGVGTVLLTTVLAGDGDGPTIGHCTAGAALFEVSIGEVNIGDVEALTFVYGDSINEGGNSGTHLRLSGSYSGIEVFKSCRSLNCCINRRYIYCGIAREDGSIVINCLYSILENKVVSVCRLQSLGCIHLFGQSCRSSADGLFRGQTGNVDAIGIVLGSIVGSRGRCAFQSGNGINLSLQGSLQVGEIQTQIGQLEVIPYTPCVGTRSLNTNGEGTVGNGHLNGADYVFSSSELSCDTTHGIL